MKKQLLFLATAAATFVSLQQLSAQNGSPYWSLAGNSNATSTSKLGTTNGVNLKLYTNNSARLTILSSNGYVGIGTTAPTSRLTINAASSPFRASINGSTKLLVSSGGGLTVGSGSSAPSNGLYVAGNVGIGTTAPSQKLHVVGTIYGASSTGNGIHGYTSYQYGNGVYGQSPYIGVYGTSGVYGVFGSATQIGVFGQGGNYGLAGTATTSGGTGVWGQGGSIGVNGSGSSYGVYGQGLNGVYGVSNVGGGNAVRAYTTQSSSYGVSAVSSQSIGVYAYTGNASSYAGYFLGRVYSSGGFTSSDRKLKQDITDLNSAMDIINKLQPKTYTFRQDGNYKLMNLPQGKHYGLIAQDVEQILPELVANADFNTARIRPPKQITTPAGASSTPSNPVTDPQTTGAPENNEVIEFKTLNYTELIPIMVRAMQEQQQKIEELQLLVNKLMQEKGASIITGAGSLSQNTPNPARVNTRIAYNLPTATNQAQLLITDAAGKTIKNLQLNTSGVVDLNTSTLSSGIYNYTLVVNGKIIETRKMTIAR
jgi:hypothetical protein